jgi:hypothetical protein
MYLNKKQLNYLLSNCIIEGKILFLFFDFLLLRPCTTGIPQFEKPWSKGFHVTDVNSGLE